MEKILVIVGPTATGKTKLALHLAKDLNGEIISADSRQVYKGLDIGTGKDVPQGFDYKTSHILSSHKRVGFYTNGETRIWGYDLVSPSQEFSVAEYLKVARKIIEDIGRRGKLPILIGGTGLYIKGVLDGINTLRVPRDLRLREELEYESADELFEMLRSANPGRASSMNSSDRKNPRRLIRAIEIVRHGKSSTKEKTPLITDNLIIGLGLGRQELEKRIEERVEKRLQQGVEGEVKRLIASKVSWNSQAMSSLGYSVWKEYFEGKKAKKDLVEEWRQAEKKYAKRQMTWFKKQKNINWFDIGLKDWRKNVEKLVKKWYDRAHGD